MLRIEPVNSGAIPGAGKSTFRLTDGHSRRIQVLPWQSPLGIEIGFWGGGTMLLQFSATTAEELAQLAGMVVWVPDSVTEIHTLLQAGPPQSRLNYVLISEC